MLQLIRNTTLVVTPILFFYDRNLPIEYLFSPDNRFFLFYWLFVPMLIWFFYEKKIHISISNRNDNDSNISSHSEENISLPKKKSRFNEVKSILAESWKESAPNHSGTYFVYWYILQILLTIIFFFIIGMPLYFIFGWDSLAFYIITILISAGLGSLSADEIVKKVKSNSDTFYKNPDPDKMISSAKTKMLNYYKNSPGYYWFQILMFALLTSVPLTMIIFSIIDYFFQGSIKYDYEFIGIYLLCFVLISINFHKHYQK